MTVVKHIQKPDGARVQGAEVPCLCYRAESVFEVHMHCQHKQEPHLSNRQVAEVIYVCKWALAEDSGAALLLLAGKVGCCAFLTPLAVTCYG